MKTSTSSAWVLISLSLLVSFAGSSASSQVAKPDSKPRSAASLPASSTPNTAPNLWTWVGGTAFTKQRSITGTLGVSAAGNAPGGTSAGAGWTDQSGNLWLFGTTNWLFNTLWKYSPSTNQWTWMKGANDGTNDHSIYNTLGVPTADTTPGARDSVSSWTDLNGNFWLFGGHDATGSGGSLNELWSFNPITNEWTWVSGSNSVVCGLINCGVPGVYGTLGVASPSNVPGGRSGAVGWADTRGNFWVFGGIGFDSTSPSSQNSGGTLNDLWMFNPSTKQWTWEAGPNTVNQPGVYGQEKIFSTSNTPPSFTYAARWADKSGNLWLFGTYNGDTELWEFDTSLKQWALMGGNRTCVLPCAQKSTYGTLGATSPESAPGARWNSDAWTDNAGNFWMFGGYGVQENSVAGELNELWRFDFATKEWAWMGGLPFVLNGNGAPSVYGNEGSPAPGNIPGGREAGVTWVDAQGNLWFFGGKGLGIRSDIPIQELAELNDLWVYHPSSDPLPTTATPVISANSGSYETIQTVTISDATNGAVIFYTTDGTEPTSSSAVFSGPINVASSQTVKAYAVASGCYDSQTASATYTITKAAYPTPAVNGLSPAFMPRASAGFTLLVNGTGFTTNSTVYWGTTALSTQAVSATQLAAQVPGPNILNPGNFKLSVQNPTPGGGTSNTFLFQVDSARAGSLPSPTFSPDTASIAASASATYRVTLPSTVISATASCLNLPTGANCTYSPGTLTISTSPTVPKGTYHITVVFDETLPLSVAAFPLPFFFVPLLFGMRRSGRRTLRTAVSASVLLLLCILVCNACGGGGGSGSGSNPPPVTQTHDLTSSGVVNLTVN